MDLTEILNGKRVCTLITCNREPYTERVKQHEYVYEMIQRNGFIFFYVYSDETLDTNYKVEFIPDKQRYSLTIKCPELWDALAKKLHMCYSFFNEYHIQGILKIDDDIDINTEYESLIFDNRTFTYDYLGINSFDIGKIVYNNGTEVKKEDFLYNNKPIQYFSGPFYWISKQGIQRVVSEPPVTLWEDVNVGFCMTKWEECKKKNTFWYNQHIVYWS
jgi:hypothetical protein